jgi:hypothetical protein
MKPGFTLRLLVTALIGFSSQLDAATEFVAVSATAAPGYVRPRDSHGHVKPETYVFSPGHELASGTADNSVKNLTFESVAQTVALGLARQGYFPTKDADNADLAIILHWGTTFIYEGDDKQNAIERYQNSVKDFTDRAAAYASSGDAASRPNASELNQTMDVMQSAADSAASAEARNAALLGYTRTLNRTMSPSEELTLRMELNEERYFVVLMAYDYRFMKKEHKPRLLWTTRLSIRTPGHNFREALPALARAGGDVFGTESGGLQRTRVDPRRATVELGDEVILGTVDQVDPKK